MAAGSGCRNLRKYEEEREYLRVALLSLTEDCAESIFEELTAEITRYFDYAIYPVDKANVASRKIPESLWGTVFAEKQVQTMSGDILDEVIYKRPYETLKHGV